MRVNRWIITIALCTVFSMPTITLACGESLFRVGKGVTYREYNAPIPGNIVMIARTRGELAMAERIAAAGHQVTVVSDATQLSTMVNENTDIVMAWYSERDMALAAAAKHEVAYLPVTANGELRMARSQYRQAISSDGDVKDFLKAIHRTLRQHRA